MPQWHMFQYPQSLIITFQNPFKAMSTFNSYDSWPRRLPDLLPDLSLALHPHHNTTSPTLGQPTPCHQISLTGIPFGNLCWYRPFSSVFWRLVSESGSISSHWETEKDAAVWHFLYPFYLPPPLSAIPPGWRVVYIWDDVHISSKVIWGSTVYWFLLSPLEKHRIAGLYQTNVPARDSWGLILKAGWRFEGALLQVLG